MKWKWSLKEQKHMQWIECRSTGRRSSRERSSCQRSGCRRRRSAAGRGWAGGRTRRTRPAAGSPPESVGPFPGLPPSIASPKVLLSGRMYRIVFPREVSVEVRWLENENHRVVQVRSALKMFFLLRIALLNNFVSTWNVLEPQAEAQTKNPNIIIPPLKKLISLYGYHTSASFIWTRILLFTVHLECNTENIVYYVYEYVM